MLKCGLGCFIINLYATLFTYLTCKKKVGTKALGNPLSIEIRVVLICKG